MLQDGDEAFLRIDARTPPQLLQPGTAADAVNKRFDDGMAGPRYGVALERWGMAPSYGTRGRQMTNPNGGDHWLSRPVELSGFIIGKTYEYVEGNSTDLSSEIASDGGHPPFFSPGGHVVSASGFFVAQAESYYLWKATADGSAITAAVYVMISNPCAFKRWDTPGRTDVLILLTDDWRAPTAYQAVAEFAIGVQGTGYQPGSTYLLLGGVFSVQASLQVESVLVVDAALANPGMNYSPLDVLTLTFDDTPMTIRVETVDGGGAILTFTVLTSGVSLSAISNPVAAAGGTGTGAMWTVVFQIGTVSIANAGVYQSLPANPVSLENGDSTASGDVTWSALTAGEDGGRGRAYRILSGNEPLEIPLNGHDVWSMSKLVPTQDGLVCFRDGNERHYFGPAAVDPGADTIQLNTTPGWKDGDLVFYHAEANSAIFGINTDSRFYVKDAGSNKVELYYDIGLTQLVDLLPGLPIGRFYLERQATNAGYFGNGAPPLILEGNEAGNSAFEVGFKAVLPNVLITDTDDDIATAANHRLTPGDAVLVTGLTGVTASTTYYATPVNAHSFRLYDTVDNALIDDGVTGLVALTDNETGTVTRLGANAQPLPPCRDGIEYKQRIVAINGEDNLLISDPLDPLHYTPFAASLTAALGTSQRVIGLSPIGPDTLLIYKTSSVIAIENLSRPADEWRRTEVTREYGADSSAAIVQAGRDVWAFGRRGVMAISQTDLGAVQGVAVPVSRAVQKYIDLIDWTRAGEAAAALWNNRYFLAAPLSEPRTYDDGRVNSTLVLTYNFLNEGWEGKWEGYWLDVYAFARHTVFGEERLCFVDHECNVCYLTDGFTDGADAIEDELVTRIYTAGNTRQKTWLQAALNLDQHNSQVSAEARAPGHQETRSLLDKTYDPTKYLTHDQPDYNPETATAEDFDKPHREDYALTPGELLVGKMDVHQNVNEDRRMRLSDWGVQISIRSTRGSCRVRAIGVKGVQAEQHGRKG